MLLNVISYLGLPSPWDWAAFSVAAFAAYWQFKTEKNTSNMPWSLQKARLKGLFRHLYRNMVCVRAMEILLKRANYHLSPSAEHLLKLKLDIDEINEESFYTNQVLYDKLKELKLQMRNVNYEIDVADRYFSSQKLPREAKERMIKTLFFKQGLIATQVKGVLMSDIKSNEKEVNEYVIDTVTECAKKNSEKWIQCKHEPLKENERLKITKKDIQKKEESNLFIDVFKKKGEKELARFLEDFNTDVMIETGLNDKDEPKIALF